VENTTLIDGAVNPTLKLSPYQRETKNEREKPPRSRDSCAIRGYCVQVVLDEQVLAFLLESILSANREREVHVGLRKAVSIVDAIASDDGVGGDAEDPVLGTVQIKMSAQDRAESKLVVVEINNGWRISAKILLEVAVGAADKGVGN
jgi:hypothetical protein